MAMIAMQVHYSIHSHTKLILILRSPLSGSPIVFQNLNVTNVTADTLRLEAAVQDAAGRIMYVA